MCLLLQQSYDTNLSIQNNTTSLKYLTFLKPEFYTNCPPLKTPLVHKTNSYLSGLRKTDLTTHQSRNNNYCREDFPHFPAAGKPDSIRKPVFCVRFYDGVVNRSVHQGFCAAFTLLSGRFALCVAQDKKSDVGSSSAIKATCYKRICFLYD